MPQKAIGEKSQWFRTLLPFVLLYIIGLLLSLSLVEAANHQQVLTKEEASTSFVAPTFTQLHLQHHVYLTNFWTYVVLLSARKFSHGIFYGRFLKAVVAALLAPGVFGYLKKR